MRESKPSALGNLLQGALSRHGIGERVLAAQVVSKANELVSEFLSPVQRGEVIAVSYKASELVLACKTPTARYAAEGFAKRLGRQLEEIYPNQTFKKIVCVFKNTGTNDDEWYNGATV